MSYRNKYKNLIIGLIITLIDINTNNLNISPDFIGYIIVFYAINGLQCHHSHIKKAKYCAVMLTLLSLLKILSELSWSIQSSVIFPALIIPFKILLYYFLSHALMELISKKDLHHHLCNNIEFAWRCFFHLSLIMIFVIVFQLLQLLSSLSSIVIILHLASEIYLIFLIHKVSKTFED